MDNSTLKPDHNDSAAAKFDWPWILKYEAVQSPDGRRTASIIFGEQRQPDDIRLHAIASAAAVRLIIAAPDMLAALQHIVRSHDEWRRADDGDGLSAARAAITKAVGDQSDSNNE